MLDSCDSRNWQSAAKSGNVNRLPGLQHVRDGLNIGNRKENPGLSFTGETTMKATNEKWDWKDGMQLTVGIAGDPEGNPVCHIVGEPGKQFARARLIASAPELLEALTAVLRHYAPSAMQSDLSGNSQTDAILRNAVETIRKATAE